MPYECRIYKGHPDDGAKVVKTYNPDQVAKRAASLALVNWQKKTPVREIYCRICGNTFFTQKPNVKYCPGSCDRLARQRGNIVNGKRRRARMKDMEIEQ